MNKNLRMVISLVLTVGAVGGVVYIYKSYKKSKMPTGGATNPENFIGRGSASKAPKAMVVGGYNAQTNQTYIYPQGNAGGGYWVNGSVNVPQGTTFTP